VSGGIQTAAHQMHDLATPAAAEDRSALLRDAVTLTMEAAHGLQRMNEQQIGNMLGSLVRTKLLSADDSYKLKDRLLNPDEFERALDRRIQASLNRRGFVTEQMFSEMQTRLSNLENS